MARPEGEREKEKGAERSNEKKTRRENTYNVHHKREM